MKTRDIRDLVRFTEDAARTEVLYETPHLWSQVICLQGSQGHGPIVDESADALAVIVTGEVAAQVGSGRARMKQWESAVVPAGEAFTVRNASPEPAVVLLVVAPPPADA